MRNKNTPDWEDRYNKISLVFERLLNYFYREDSKRLQISDIRKYQVHYEFVPNQILTVIKGMEILSKLLKPEKNLKTFVDAGCGIGWVVSLASKYRFDTYGIELGKENYEISRQVNYYSNIYNEDILTHDFSKYDVVYYYCPFKDWELEVKFERKVENELKKGSYIFANLKIDKKITKDKRFKEVASSLNPNNDKHTYAIWQKIKEY